MTNIKTAISLPENLFDQADKTAQELKLSRSRLFALALEDFMRRYQNNKLLKQINEAYSDMPDQEENTIQRKMQRLQRQSTEAEWT